MSIWNVTNVLRESRACFASLAGIGLAIASASLAAAEYGPRLVIGTNYQQTSTTMSVTGVSEGSCTNAPLCFVLFQPAPGQKKLIVQHVSCFVNVSTGNVLYGQLRTRIGQTSPLRFTFLAPVNMGGGYWAVNNPAKHLVESKAHPRVVFTASGLANWKVYCSISGELQQS